MKAALTGAGVIATLLMCDMFQLGRGLNTMVWNNSLWLPRLLTLPAANATTQSRYIVSTAHRSRNYATKNAGSVVSSVLYQPGTPPSAINTASRVFLPHVDADPIVAVSPESASRIFAAPDSISSHRAVMDGGWRSVVLHASGNVSMVSLEVSSGSLHIAAQGMLAKPTHCDGVTVPTNGQFVAADLLTVSPNGKLAIAAVYSWQASQNGSCLLVRDGV